MNLFRHYKNKDYRVRGIAKHSETLAEHVVYETRYDNPKGKLWIRPRAMFEEDVEVAGMSVPRFAEIALRIQTHDHVGASEEAILGPLVTEILGHWDPARIRAKLQHHPKILLQLAFVEAEPVGFKLGYALDEQTFYSWLGGVRPAYRGLGIADDLMTAQHEWCRRQQYTAVRTKSQNRWRGQMMLNLRHGFDVTGYDPSGEGGPKITMEKCL